MFLLAPVVIDDAGQWTFDELAAGAARAAGALHTAGVRRGDRVAVILPEERAWLSRVFDDLGWIDVYRRLHPETTGESYTWWSNRGQAWANNVGWRIDYQIATPGLACKATQASVYKETRFSDHAPLIIDYSLAG